MVVVVLVVVIAVVGGGVVVGGVVVGVVVVGVVGVVVIVVVVVVVVVVVIGLAICLCLWTWARCNVLDVIMIIGNATITLWEREASGNSCRHRAHRRVACSAGSPSCSAATGLPCSFNRHVE